MNLYPKLVGTSERKMCGCKVRHSTKELAIIDRGRIMSLDPNVKINVYQCPYCHFWHVGRQRDSKC